MIQYWYCLLVWSKRKLIYFHMIVTLTIKSFLITGLCDSTSISTVVRQKGESHNGGNKKTKHAKCSEKTNLLYHLIRTRTCGYQRVRNVCLLENWAWFVFLLTPFSDSSFCLITGFIRIFLQAHTTALFEWNSIIKCRSALIEKMTQFQSGNKNFWKYVKMVK